MAHITAAKSFDWKPIVTDPLWVDGTVTVWTESYYDYYFISSFTATFADGTSHTIAMEVRRADIASGDAIDLINLVEAKIENAVEAMREYARSKKVVDSAATP